MVANSYQSESFPWSDSFGRESVHKDLIVPLFDDCCFEWIGDWTLVIDEHTDQEGWSYANNFKSKSFGSKKGMMDMVRKRKWVCKCRAKSG
jgi:hypothetical protein